jgi:hypothetical protein
MMRCQCSTERIKLSFQRSYFANNSAYSDAQVLRNIYRILHNKTQFYFGILSSRLGYLSGVALGYELDCRRFKSSHGLGIFLLTMASRPALGPIQLPIQWVPGAPSLEVKRPRSEADHSPTSSAVVNECMELYFHYQYVFMAWCSVKKSSR